MHDRELVERIRETFPQELLELDQWVLWRRVERNGRATKQPYTAAGALASSTDPGTWSPFDQAARAYDAGTFDGLGFVFSDVDPYCGIDFDAHSDGGQLDDWALERVNRLDSYTEWSPSGAGVHVIVRAALPGSGRNSRDMGLEMYTAGRFFTVTGRPLDDRTWHTIPERQAAADWLYAQFPVREAAPGLPTVGAPSTPVDLDDAALFDRILASKQGDTFRRLWAGDKSAYNGDESAADLALCNLLAFWTGKDPQRMDRLFRQSGLFRDKWDRNARAGETYGAGTIRMAIDGTSDTYQLPTAAPAIQWPTNGHASSNGNGAGPAKTTAADAFAKGSNDLGNAQFAFEHYGAHFAYTEALGWLHHVGTHWEREAAEAKVHGAVVEALKERCALALAGHDLDMLRAATPSAKHTRDALFHFRHMATVPTRQFDTAGHLLNCKNGVVDLRTGDLVAHTPSDRFTYCVNTEYIPGERSELWERLLLDWFGGDHDVILYLQRAMGYTVTGENREECLFYMHGPGRAGKGTLVNSVAHLLGAPIAQAVDFDAFTSDNDAQNFRLAPLRAARMVTASESKKGRSMNEKTVKNITGGDTIQAAYKHRDPFTFSPTFKLWMMSNDVPRGDVDDDAFWYRVRLFTLTKSHMGGEDNGIKATLAQPAHRRGVLAWLVLGAMRWYERGLGTPAQIWQNAKTAREEQDQVHQWLRDCCTLREGVETPAADLYISYTAWCTENGIDRAKLSRAGLTNKLRSKGFPNRRTRIGLSPATVIDGVLVSTD